MWQVSPTYRAIMNKWHLSKIMPWRTGDRFMIVPFEEGAPRGEVEFKCKVVELESSYVLSAIEPFTAKFNFIPDVIYLFHNDKVMGTYNVPPHAKAMKNFNLEIGKLLTLQKINMKRSEEN